MDILNEANLNDFVKKMKSDLLKQIDFEQSILAEYYSEEEIKLILNDKYNFIITKENFEMGRIDFEDLKEF